MAKAQNVRTGASINKRFQFFTCIKYDKHPSHKSKLLMLVTPMFMLVTRMFMFALSNQIVKEIVDVGSHAIKR